MLQAGPCRSGKQGQNSPNLGTIFYPPPLYRSELRVESAGRRWSGALTCAASNMHGRATAKLQIKVTLGLQGVTHPVG